MKSESEERGRQAKRRSSTTTLYCIAKHVDCKNRPKGTCQKPHHPEFVFHEDEYGHKWLVS